MILSHSGRGREFSEQPKGHSHYGGILATVYATHSSKPKVADLQVLIGNGQLKMTLFLPENTTY